MWIEVPNERGPRNPMTGEPMTRTREPRVITSACPHTYQEWVAQGPQPPTCSNCGELFSVRVCADCAAALCGQVSCATVRHNRLQCPSCAVIADADKAGRDREQHARDREERERVREEQDREAQERAQRHQDAVREREAAGRPVQSIRADIDKLTRATARPPGGSGPFSRVRTGSWIIAWLLLCGLAFTLLGGDEANGWVLIPAYAVIALVLFELATGPERRSDAHRRRLARLRAVERELGCGVDSCRTCYSAAAS